MNYPYFFKLSKGFKAAVLLSLVACFIFYSCAPEPHVWEPKSTEQVAGDYIKNNPDKFSEFAKLIDKAGMASLLNIRGPYTIMVPTDSAMFAYYQMKNINSLDDISIEDLKILAKNHIVPAEIPVSDIGLGALREPNALGDYLATEFHGADVYVNKLSKIVDQDVRTANGFIHVINRVIEPLTHNVYSLVAADPDYSIFSKGLELTGLKDTLEMIDFAYGTKRARNRYTLMAVPDSIYRKNSINSVNDLIAWTGATADNMTLKTNLFYRYMEYHCLNNSYFLSNFTSSLYPILSRDNNISVTIEDDYKINFNRKENIYTGFIIDESNYPAKNGVVHAVNGTLPVTDPEPYPVTFETTDFIEFKEGDFYGKYYYRWHDGQNSFEKIKFVADYLLYYYKPNHGRSAILNNDNISLLGYWWVEVTFPKVMKGKYAVTANIWTGGEDLPIFDAYIDGVKVPNSPFNARISSTRMDFGEVTFTKTEEHKVKLVCVGWGVVFWDSVTFTPIKMN
ncbi:MAG TPA: fasciclin domain-containing protein [Prolixibacteraceae bacterium]|nr:fasciclin domain-containing protein [Prolixibacteraceae bacterium]